MSKPKRGWSRLAAIGAMTTKVAGNYLGQRVRSVVTGEPRDRLRDRIQVENAKEVAQALGRLKGAAMKMGQGLSVLAGQLDLPPEVRDALSSLHSDAEPVPFETIRSTLTRELEADPDTLFATLNPTPLGTASLAQAHEATLPDGREVVVKVLHDGVDEAVETDLVALRGMLFAGRAAGRSAGEAEDIFQEMADRLREELDYLHEAANLQLYAQAFKDDPRVRVPAPVVSLCTERVLVMDRIPGVPLRRFVAEATPEARQQAGLALAELFLEQTFVRRHLHADPHPGNYLFESDGRVGLVDFGCVKRFDEFWIGTYARAAKGALEGDREAVLAACKALGAWEGDAPGAADAIWTFCEAAVGPWRTGTYVIGEDSDDLIQRVQPVSREILKYPEIRAPRNIVLLHRTLAGMYGMARDLRVEAEFGPLILEYTQYAIDIAEGRNATPPVSRMQWPARS